MVSWACDHHQQSQDKWACDQTTPLIPPSDDIGAIDPISSP